MVSEDCAVSCQIIKKVIIVEYPNPCKVINTQSTRPLTTVSLLCHNAVVFLTQAHFSLFAKIINFTTKAEAQWK